MCDGLEIKDSVSASSLLLFPLSLETETPV